MQYLKDIKCITWRDQICNSTARAVLKTRSIQTELEEDKRKRDRPTADCLKKRDKKGWAKLIYNSNVHLNINLMLITIPLL